MCLSNDCDCFKAEGCAKCSDLHRAEVGTSVTCTVCGLRKKPRGRSAPLEMANSLCDYECEGYYADPKPSDLWPGEKREEFGY